MAERGDDGMYISFDGQKFIDEAAADSRNSDAAAGKLSGSGGGGFLGGAAGAAMIAILIFGPIIAGKLVGLIWGLFLKLGMFGKIVTSLLMPLVTFFILSLVIGLTATGHMLGMGKNGSDVMIMVMFFIPPVWYFLWHYDTVKQMGALVFSQKIGKFCQFIWWGALASVLVGYWFKPAQQFIAIGTTLAGFIYYFTATKPYAEEAAQNRKASGKRSLNGLKILVMLITVGITAVFGVVAVVENSMKGTQAALELKENLPDAVWVQPRTIGVYSKADDRSEEITRLDRGTKVTPIDAVSSFGKVWLAIEINGQIGWIRDAYTREYEIDY